VVLPHRSATLPWMVSLALPQTLTVFYKNFTARLRRVYDCARRFCYASHYLLEW
jgi:hypothetical protein